MIEANSLKRQVNVMKLLYHECYRTFADRVVMAHDKQWLVRTLEEVCRAHFYVVDQLETFHTTPGSRKPKPEGE